MLTQFKSQSLLQHLSEGWQFGGTAEEPVHHSRAGPDAHRPDETWYQGTADAIYQNINLIEQADPHVVAIFGADHIYRMNITSMIEYHEQKRAQVTVAAIPVDKTHGRRVRRDRSRAGRPHHRLSTKRTRTRPPFPAIRSASTRRWATTSSPRARCCASCTTTRPIDNSTHDFGRDILPSLVGRGEMYAYDFQTNQIPGEPAGAPAYWRDVGTIDAYYEANMDLRAV